jgi:DNA-binding protein YbaB
MTAFYQQQTDELVARYQACRARAAELRKEIDEISVSAMAPRNVVKVTVGAHGEMRSVEFPNDGYKRLSRAELATKLMTTVEQAREKAMTALSELMTPELPPGLNVLGLIQGKVDIASALPQDPRIPAEVREYTEYGRRPRKDERE